MAGGYIALDFIQGADNETRSEIFGAHLLVSALPCTRQPKSTFSGESVDKERGPLDVINREESLGIVDSHCGLFPKL